MILTAFSDVDAVIDAINKGQVYRFIQKPWNEDNLRIDIEKAAELYNLRKENRELTQKLVMANQQLEFIARQNLLS
jgi:FixJ family two-component response regulator